jgi:hypothetical protein
MEDGDGNPLFIRYDDIITPFQLSSVWDDATFYRGVHMEDIYDEVDTFKDFISANRNMFPFSINYNLERWRRIYFGYVFGDEADFFIIAFAENEYTIVFHYDVDANEDFTILDHMLIQNKNIHDIHKHLHEQFMDLIDMSVVTL